MRIRGWHVRGFGLLHEFRVDDVDDGLTVVLGPNEAGKTSLLSFLRGVLFGFPDRRRRDRQYPPLRGGRWGGRLSVEADGGLWSIERYHDPASLTLSRGDGVSGTESDLRRWLGGVDADLHRSVFAFSLAELQDFESLEVEGVRDRIFAAGVVGAGRSARAAIQSLAGRRAEIGRKKADSRITQLRRRIGEIDRALDAARSRAGAHAEKRRVAEDAEREVKEIGDILSTARQRLNRMEVLLGAWPDWDERAQAQTGLSALEGAADLADDLQARLDAALGACEARRLTRDERSEKVDHVGREVMAITLDNRIEAAAAEVRRLTPRSGAIQSRRETMRDIQTKRGALHVRVNQEAALLGPDWTSDSVRRFDVSIPAAQEVADWGVRLQNRTQEMDAASERAAAASARSKEVEAQVLELARRLENAPQLPSLVELEQRERTTRSLRTHLFDLSQAEGTLRVSLEKVEELADRSREAGEAVRRVTVEVEQQEQAIRSFDDLPAEDEIATGQRALRQLRALLGDAAVEERELRHAKQRAEDAKARASDAEADASRLQADLERRQSACAAVKLPPAETLAANGRTLRELRGRLAELRSRQAELEAACVRLAERRIGAERPTERRLGALGWVSLVLAVVLGGAAALFAARGEAGLAAGAGLLCVVLVGLWAAIRPRPSTDRPGVGEAEQAVSSSRARVEAASAAALKVAQQIGLERVPDDLEVEAKADEIAGLIAARQEHDRELTALKQLASDVSVAVGVADRAKVARNAAEHAVDEQQRALAARREATADVAAGLQLDGELSLAKVEDKAAALEEQARRLRERGLVTARLQELRKECDRLTAERGRLVEALEGARQRALAAKTRVDEASSVAHRVAGELGWESLPSSADLEGIAGDTAKQVRERLERDRETADLEALQVECGNARDLAKSTAATAEDARLKVDDTQRQWEAWKVERRCPITLRPETAQQFFASIHRLREQLGTIDSWDAETAGIEREIEEFTAAVTAVARIAGTNSDGGREPEDVLRALMQRVEAQDRARHERERLSRELEGAKAALERAMREVVLASDKLQALFREAGANDEPSCRANIALSRRRADLKRQAEEAERRLRGRLGAGEAAEAVRDELATADCQGWEAVKQECKATLSRQQPAYEDAVRKHQAELEALSVLERETDVVALGMEKEGLLAETRDAVTEWRRLAIAQTLLEATLKRYETERQPAVLTGAATTFSRITGGRYTRLASKENGLDALAADGSRIDAGLLSRGTAEQLYLCLRLALAGEFARHQVSLPLIMDDVLVNFDPERAQSCAKVLAEVAAEQQVLLFTCHPDTANLLGRLRPATRIIEIGRQEPNVQLAIH